MGPLLIFDSLQDSFTGGASLVRKNCAGASSFMTWQCHFQAFCAGFIYSPMVTKLLLFKVICVRYLERRTSKVKRPDRPWKRQTSRHCSLVGVAFLGLGVQIWALNGLVAPSEWFFSIRYCLALECFSVKATLLKVNTGGHSSYCMFVTVQRTGNLTQ